MNKRRMVRVAFDIFEDQKEALRERASEEQQAGRTVVVSTLVREALDAFLDEGQAKN